MKPQYKTLSLDTKSVKLKTTFANTFNGSVSCRTFPTPNYDLYFKYTETKALWWLPILSGSVMWPRCSFFFFFKGGSMPNVGHELMTLRWDPELMLNWLWHPGAPDPGALNHYNTHIPGTIINLHFSLNSYLKHSSH